MKATNLKQKVDFTGKNIFVGIDVHKKNWSNTLYYDQQYLRSYTQPGSVEVLVNFLKKEYPNANYLCGYETGFSGFEIQRKLESQGIKCVVLNASDIPQTVKDKLQKTDRLDSRRIAHALATNSYNPVYIPDIESEADRSLVRYHFILVKDITRCKNHIKSLLFQFGVTLPEQYEKRWTKGLVKWLKECDDIKGNARVRLDLMIEQFEKVKTVYLDTNRRIAELQKSPKYKKSIEILTSVSGIGPLIAIVFMTEIIDINRFSNMRKLNSYVGFIPMEHSSGEHEIKGGITVRTNKLLRTLLIEASWIAIRQDPTLTYTYNELIKKMTGKRAIIKIARKLLSRIRYVLINETMYEKGILK
jgi:transposase